MEIAVLSTAAKLCHVMLIVLRWILNRIVGLISTCFSPLPSRANFHEIAQAVRISVHSDMFWSWAVNSSRLESKNAFRCARRSREFCNISSSRRFDLSERIKSERRCMAAPSSFVIVQDTTTTRIFSLIRRQLSWSFSRNGELFCNKLWSYIERSSRSST